MSLGSLLIEGHPVRISGQDSVRGTFTQRHWAFHDLYSNKTYFPLQNISKNKDATRSLWKVNKLGGIDSTLILINKKELPQIADKPNKPKTGMLFDRFFRLHSVT